MKRAPSRISKISSEGHESSDSLFAGIPDSKWQDFVEKEETGLFLLSLREEIVRNCMKIIFDAYMEKQAVAFTVHCSYLAWVKVLDVYYMSKDPGDYEDPKVLESWKPDEEPETCEVDSWASESMKIKKTIPQQPVIKTPKSRSSGRSSLEKACSQNIEIMSFMADLFEPFEVETLSLKQDELSSTSSTRGASIFTKTLSMPRIYLPALEPLSYINCKAGSMSVPKRK